MGIGSRLRVIGESVVGEMEALRKRTRALLITSIYTDILVKSSTHKACNQVLLALVNLIDSL